MCCVNKMRTLLIFKVYTFNLWTENKPSLTVRCYICTQWMCTHTYIHTSYIIHHFSGAPRGAFQQPVYNKCKVRWLRVLARPLQAVHNVFLSETKLCPQLTVHNTGISLLLSTSVWVLLSPPIERRETRPTA